MAGANWQEVSEVQFDGDLSYNIAPGGGAEDLFNMGSLPGGVSIVFAVQTTGAYRKLNAGSQTIRQSIVSAGTAEAGATNVMSVDYTYFTDLYTSGPEHGRHVDAGRGQRGHRPATPKSARICNMARVYSVNFAAVSVSAAQDLITLFTASRP